MVLCVIGDYGTKSGQGKGGVYSVPAIITQQGKEFEELRQERRNLQISMIDRANMKAESVFQPGLFAHVGKLGQVQCRLGSDTSLNQKTVQEKDVKATAK